ncbi:hypothetical protein VTK73DRAFT_6898 [Phialemonium thermophilum]|uniref:Non-specific serine/threonine protein kinase n=1 Tax=Phialemonium thermophilum TaxID=223376 RepID=A0ABR3WHK3_9PEZI
MRETSQRNQGERGTPKRYGPGVQLDIQTHVPPPPFPYYRNDKDWGKLRQPIREVVDDSDDSDEPSLDRVAIALSAPPLETAPPPEIERHQLTIVKKLGYRQEGRGAVVVTCHLDGDASRVLVAKIYDGLEYPVASYGYDFMYLADRDYSREAGAYRAFPQSFQGSIVPRYFGSWTFPVEEIGRGVRWVRMILVEHVDGQCVFDLILRAKGATGPPYKDIRKILEQPVDYALLPPESERLEVLAAVIENDIKLSWFAGVVHHDIAPRNVLYRREDSTLRVVIIDFNDVEIRTPRLVEKQRRGERLLPLSPIERYWAGSNFSEFAEWVPPDWDSDRDLGRLWLCERWWGSPCYRPPYDDFDDYAAEFLEKYGDRYSPDAWRKKLGFPNRRFG